MEEFSQSVVAAATLEGWDRVICGKSESRLGGVQLFEILRGKKELGKNSKLGST